MDLLFKYQQEKKSSDKTKTVGSADIKLWQNENILYFDGYYSFDFYSRNDFTTQYYFELDLVSGNIKTKHEVVHSIKNLEQKRTITKEKVNDFKSLLSLIIIGIERGDKSFNYWGTRFTKSMKKLKNKIFDIIHQCFKTDYYKNKDYTYNCQTDWLYELMVDYFLERKNIKAHDNVYEDIQQMIPKKKWLEKNDNKFIPAILDELGIKSKYLIAELNKKINYTIYFKTLQYLCKLFGDNYIEYIKNFEWQSKCYELIPVKKIHTLKNEHEKKAVFKLFKLIYGIPELESSLIVTLNRLFEIRIFLEKNGVELKFKLDKQYTFDHLSEQWFTLNEYYKKGYKVKFDFDEEFIKHIESDIQINNKIYQPKILKCESDFNYETIVMKNCMSRQFEHGLFYIYVSLKLKNKRINLQYRRGELTQLYGKANSQVPETFQPAIKILTERLRLYKDLKWKKIKYDFLEKQ